MKAIIIVQLEKSPNISLQASTILDIQNRKCTLAKYSEIKQIVARVVLHEIGLDPMSFELKPWCFHGTRRPADTWPVLTSKQALIEENYVKCLRGFPCIKRGTSRSQFPNASFLKMLELQYRWLSIKVSVMILGILAEIGWANKCENSYTKR